MIENKEYKQNTIGYHRQYAEKIFGEGSAPVLWLDEQAEKANAGYDEKASMPEPQIVKHLRTLHEQELLNEDEDAADEEGFVDDEDLDS